ncbi:MAG TPA: hypothetical protein PLT66_06540, partial [Bacillota bacterium]|nr:hypothetical protein [Bacillota bacterium]
PGSTVSFSKAVTGGEGDTSHGVDFCDETGDGKTVAITVNDYNGRKLYLKGSFRFELYGLPVSGSFDSTYISITENIDDLFGDYNFEGYFLYGQYAVTSDSGASVTFSEPDRNGKECLVLYYDGAAASTLYEGTFGGEYTVENAQDGVYALYIKEKEFNVVISCGTNGSVSPDGTMLVREGDDLTITVRPNSGYEIDEVRVGGDSAVLNGNKYTFTNVQASTTFYVTFKKSAVTDDKHTVTIRVSSGGSVSPSSTAKVTDGGSLTLTMTPNDGFYLKRITVDGESVSFSGNQYTLESVTADCVVAVTYAALTKYSVIAQYGDGGTVTPESALVSSGGSAKFVVTPEAGYEISRVSVDSGELTNSGNVYTVSKVKQDVTFTVIFKRDDSWGYNCLIVSDVSWNTSPLTLELLDYTVISAEVLKKVASEHSYSKVYAVASDYSYAFEPGAFAGLGSENLDFSLSVTASAHDSFAAGSENYGVVYASSALPESIVTLSLGTGNAATEYEVYVFASDTYTSIGKYVCDLGGKISFPYTGAQTALVKTGDEPIAFKVEIQGSGSTDPSGTKMIIFGGSLTVSFTPDDGYMVGKVLLNGNELEYDKSGLMTFTDITKEVTLTVVFEIAGSTGKETDVGNTAMIVLIVFGSMMILCACAYLIMRRKGLIKYKKEL